MAKVHVVLLDGQRVLGETELDAEQLPASFAEPTTLHLGGDDWQVVRAEPVTREAYVARGKLQLELRKVEYVDPRTILFSLPTLENTMPPLSDAAVPADAVALHADDWRQRELVSARFAAAVAAERADIRAIFADHRSGAAFRKLHVRERIPEPLVGTAMRVDELATWGARRALAIGSTGEAPALVEGGFAFVGAAGTVYGREADGGVVALALTAGSDAAALQPLARTHDLLLVDWCARDGAD